MTHDTILALGRVSNLPTVWTNAIAGAVLGAGGAAPSFGAVILSALALTLFYEGGMWLNDAFDAEIDARERKDRPIPRGEIARSTVFTGGFAMLGGGMWLSLMLGGTAVLIGLALTAAIVLYDWLHKRTSLSPVIMGATRFFSYLLAGAAAATLTGPLVFGALGLFAFVIGLTYSAKQEAYDQIGSVWPLAVLALPVLYALWAGGGGALALLIWLGFVCVVALALWRLFRRNPGDVPKAVVTMIAGISLYDGVLVAGQGFPALALLCVGGFAATLALQRVASGT